MQRNPSFENSLRNLILTEIEKPRPAAEIIVELDAGSFSPHLEKFLILRSGASEKMIRNDVVEASLRDFQSMFSRGVMYLLIAALMGACFEIGTARLNYLSFVYGALSFYAVVIFICYFHQGRIMSDRAALLGEYRESLRAVLKSLEERA